jgi:hypothetical protein
LNFSAAVMRPDGWSALSGIFAKPPVSTQQILHPALYKSGKIPPKVMVPSMDKDVGADWTKLEDNIMGEFGWKEVLKQFLGEEKATPPSSSWNGDRYVVYEQKKTKRLLLITRLDLATEGDATHFFTAYSEALEKKHDQRTSEVRQRESLSFDTTDGGVFFRCVRTECATLEGGDRSLFEKLSKELHWEALPGKGTEKTTTDKPANRGIGAPQQSSAPASSAIR